MKKGFPVHTAPKKFENPALSIPSDLYKVSKTLLKREEFENAGF